MFILLAMGFVPFSLLDRVFDLKNAGILFGRPNRPPTGSGISEG